MFCGSGGKGRKGMLKYILITGIVLIVISSLWDRYAAIFPDGKRGIGAMGERRLENLTSGLESVLENPVTGIGLNNYAFLFEGSDLIEAHTTLHNYYLLIAAESGIIMLISFMLLLFKLGSAFSEICFAGSQIYRYGCAGIAAGTLGVCVHSLVTWELRQPPNGILFHALIGVVLGAGAVLRGSRSQANVFQQRIKR
jgi:O-antigen ligase